MPGAIVNGGGYPQIKAEAASPDASHIANGPTVTQTENGSENLYEASIGGDTIPINAGFYRKDRSDAPPPSERPSERPSESEPMLREMRIPARENGVTSPPNEDSLNFQTSFRELGKKLKAHNDTLGELQGLGVSHDVPLPELVLVGDQSAGKSSVMSGLANLDLPRSEGTCTRCPLHIRVSRNSDWSCRVSLQKMYKYDPPPNGVIDEKDVTDKDPFHPWRKLVNSSTTEFKTVHDNSEIEQVLRWAQVAILNPDKPSELFVPGSGALAQAQEGGTGDIETTAKFSPNVVFLEIKGPDMPNLSFYDLPGIFQNSKEARDSYTIHVVKNLSRSYIKRESAIIMCSMPMNSDAENSCTFSEVRKLGASDRTVGVLTKADLLPSSNGRHDQWLEIMEGKAHRTGLGYFITSRPEKMDLEQLSKWEEDMFRSVDMPWPESRPVAWPEAFHKFGDRCGVEPLKELLSHRLGEQFAKSLPHIEKKVKVQLNKICSDLEKLPDLPRNTEHEVKKSLREFSEAARRNIETFRQKFNTLPENFRNCVIGIHPKFRLQDQSDHPVIDIIDSDDDDEPAPATTTTPSKRRATPMAPPETPSKRPRTSTAASQLRHVKREVSEGANSPNGHNGNNGTNGTNGTTPLPPAKYAAPFDKFDNIGRGFRTLAQVREEMKEKARAGMPGRITPEVYDSLALEGLKPIEQPMMTFLVETQKLIAKELTDALKASLGASGLQNRLIFQECRKYLKAFLQKHMEDTKIQMSRCYRMELTQITTWDPESLQRFEEAELLTLTRWRHKQRMIAHGDPKAIADKEKPLRDWATMSEAERDAETKKRATEIQQKIGTDRFAREIEVISYVRGYYRLASQRFVDNVIQCVFCLMIPAMKDELGIYLDEKLGLIGNVPEQKYRWLMEEDATTSTRRETLRRERTKFEKALASINALKRGDVESADEDDQDTVMDGADGEM